MKKINECVQQGCEEESSRIVAKKRKVGGKHNMYSQEDRAQIGKYAAENGATKAARHFLIRTIFFS